MFPKRLQFVSKFFRSRRNRKLCELIAKLHGEAGRKLEVLDVGGSYIFWSTIPQHYRAMCTIRLLNLPGAYELMDTDGYAEIRNSVESLTGDARSMPEFSDGQFDLLICNSVIEHVGNWNDMQSAATEAKRLSGHGWIQVPAFEFPIEQHFLTPLAHWFADPIQRRILKLFNKTFRGRTNDEMFMSMYHTRPLSRWQMRQLFPDATLRSEWLIFPKSHIATW